MRKMVKKVICILSATMCILGSAITASADTIQFNVTPPSDPYSYSVRKADTEQRFYMTGTYFSKNGVLNGYSQQLANGNVISNTASISPSSTSSSATYSREWAAPNLLYQLFTWTTVNGFNVIGRYTP